MTCADARHIILTADPAALHDRADATLRAHLDGCPRCSADASHVVDDVARLRMALIARESRVAPPRRRSRHRTVATLIPIALAAELALFAFLSTRETAHPLLDRKVIDDSVTTLLPAVPTKIDVGVNTDPPRAAPESSVVPAIAMTGDTTHDPDTLRAPYPSAPSSSLPTSHLHVIPASDGQRIAVTATSNPRVTVAWLSKVDSL